MSDKLKPCPFGCGTEPVLKHYQRGPYLTDYWITCPQCKIEVGRSGIPANTIAAWNARAESVNQKMLEALREIGRPHKCTDGQFRDHAQRTANTAIAEAEAQQ